MFITRTRATIVALAAASSLLLAAGCSDDSSDAPAHHSSTTTSASPTSATAGARTDFNDADVTFLQMMYPHHAQAVEMAKMVPSRTQNEQLIALAAQVEQAQAPEMQQITTLLTSFGKPAPTTGGGHEGHGMPGMMTAEQMSALEAATGAEFDRQWLEMMIEHHEGAVDMANTELTGGVNAESKQLATAIVSAQEAEISTMRGMLGQN
ncbi:hypothetical protein NN3_05180 [Nocardia neocaledoniensis NBRC 108232]|uniref:Uncharacterized protein (DUF305 family) n=1 Tax=Nocardia neocaledoniensis TaxID=236511 RepID=A0A317NXA6_9NOCA|nr:DUF305 domain-containing protein [Nocardia neocaledoniensis]PWV79647.1 uncharacterized protein (DUF305 family) [Nocardia neocaledoniensis]GEM29511.1 hypothetical protein NN3_05180 [Nocardia neocaledoniensis NBRC 108232]